MSCLNLLSSVAHHDLILSHSRHSVFFKRQSSEQSIFTVTTHCIATRKIISSLKLLALGKLTVSIDSSSWIMILHWIHFIISCKFHLKSEQQEQYKCLVLPPATQGRKLGLLLSYAPGSLQQYCSHRVTTRDGSVYETRLMVKIKDTDQPVDPLNFRYHDGEIVFLTTYCYAWTQRLMMPPFTFVTTPLQVVTKQGITPLRNGIMLALLGIAT